MMVINAVVKAICPSYVTVLLSAVTICVYYATYYRTEFVDNGKVSFEAIRSKTFCDYLFICLGGAITQWCSIVAGCLGKYLIKEELDRRFVTQGVLALIILIPSFVLLTELNDISAISFFWPLFHVQIIVVMNVAILFWAEKMGLSKRSPAVIVNSTLCCATFTMHLFATGPSWSSTSTDGCNIVYMFLFALSLVALLASIHQTRQRSSKTSSVVLIDTAAVEQQWAVCIITSLLCYYVGFLVLEAAVFPGNDRFHLQATYVTTQYIFLSVTTLVFLTLHQRKDMYHGVMSQTSLEIKRLFVRYVSHEIRTPLNTTLLGLNLLENDLKEGETDTAVLSELISDATSSCTIAIGILNDLLMYEKIDGGLLTLERAETPVWEFVEGVMKAFLIQAKSSGVELAWPKRCVKGVYAEIDPYKLSQVLRNLVSNALKFTPSGGRVRISAEVLLPGAKPRTARSLSVLKEMDEDKAEVEENSSSGANSAGNKRIKKISRNKPASKSQDFEDLQNASVNRSLSAASEETPPHTYTFPASNNSPMSRAGVYSTRGVLVPEASSTSVDTAGLAAASARAVTAGVGATRTSTGTIETTAVAGAMIGAAAGYSSRSHADTADLETGLMQSGNEEKLIFQGEEGGTSKNYPDCTTPFQTNQTPANFGAPLSKDSEARPSPESSKESSPPSEGPKSFFAGTKLGFARRLFSSDADSKIQVFPSVNVVRISVTDSGAGISKENQERLFNEIVQFNAGKLQNGQGSGIGLWISNTIVKLHGGKIGVMSDGEGNGSTFYIEIPISKIDRGSNYKHVSPAHTDVSSKHKYKSPMSSPDGRNGKKLSSSSPNQMTFHYHQPQQQQQHYDLNRAFISPADSDRSSQRSAALQETRGTGVVKTLLEFPPLTSLQEQDDSEGAKAGGDMGVRTSLQAPLYPVGANAVGKTGIAQSTTETEYNQKDNSGAVLSKASSFRPPIDGLPKQLSDQSIFTATAGSNRSNRSRGTNQSSFSSDADGISSKTESVECSARYLPSGLTSHLEAGQEEESEQDRQHRESAITFTNYRPDKLAVNLFPENNNNNNDNRNNDRSNTSAATDINRVMSNSSDGMFEQQYRAIAPDAISSDARSTKSLFQKRALIVDDSATNRKFVNRLLRTKIGTRDEAEDGAQAVQMVAASLESGAPYDVILMDYVMPVMDGPTATAKIRKIGFKGVILGVTGNGHQAEIDLFTNAGANKIMVKPLSADQFYATLLGD